MISLKVAVISDFLRNTNREFCQSLISILGSNCCKGLSKYILLERALSSENNKYINVNYYFRFAKKTKQNNSNNEFNRIEATAATIFLLSYMPVAMPPCLCRTFLVVSKTTERNSMRRSKHEAPQMHLKWKTI